MFVVFEGIDGSGKSTLSRSLANKMGFTWGKEPDFSSEEADELNLLKSTLVFRGTSVEPDKVEFFREQLFFESRARKQELILTNDNLILDRYMWTGFAYLLMYSPSLYSEFVRKNLEFIKPDVYFFIDTPLELAYERVSSRGEPKTLEELEKIRSCYMESLAVISQYSSVHILDGTKSLLELENEATLYLQRN